MHLAIFLFATNLENFLHLIICVWFGLDDDHAIKQIDGNAVGTGVVGAANFGDAAVCCHDDDWRHVLFKSPI